MPQPPAPVRFKEVVLSLAEIMSQEMDEARRRGIKTINRDIVIFGIEFIRASDAHNMISGFINRSFVRDESSNSYEVLWDKILHKNKSFFLDNSSLIFGDLSSGIVDGFKTVIADGDEELLEAIWDHIFALVKISISHIYLERRPQITSTSDGFNIIYSVESRNHIKVEKEAAKWGVNLLEIK